MKASTFINLLVGASMLVVTACGGGGGGSSSPPAPSATGTVKITTDADWISCQDGKNGMWVTRQTNANNGIISDECQVKDPGGYYGIALAKSGDPMSLKILHGTLDEASDLYVVWNDSPSTVNISLNIANSSTNQQIVYIDSQSPYNFSSNGSHSINAPMGYWDIVAVQLDNAGNPVDYIRLLRDQKIIDGATFTIDFSQPDISVSDLAEHNLSVTGRDTQTVGAYFETRDHTYVPVHSTDFSKWTSINPSHLVPADHYVFMATDKTSTSPAPEIEWIRKYNAVNPPGDMNIDLAAIPLMQATRLDLQAAEWTSYIPSGDTPPLRAYGIKFEQSVTGSNVTWEINLSQGWLNGDTRYDIPTISQLGIPLDYDFASGEIRGNIDAIMFNASTEAMTRVADPLLIFDLYMTLAHWYRTFNVL